MRTLVSLFTGAMLAFAPAAARGADGADALIGVDVVLKTAPDDAALAALGRYGKIRDVIPSIRGVTLQARESAVDAIRALPFVAAAGPDVERVGSPVDGVDADSFEDGSSTWNLDAVNVTDLAAGRVEPLDGTGVWVAVIDSGLLDSWRRYFPEERVAEELAISFGGGGGREGTVSTQPQKWQHDQASHGTAVTSFILGFEWQGVISNGVAPNATIIPVKVLNQTNRSWASVIARGIAYVADLKNAGKLGAAPVVINLSVVGGPNALEMAAVDYAIRSGVLVVAGAGNYGTATMGYPAAYRPVISVGATGSALQWSGPSPTAWWRLVDVPDPTKAEDFYVPAFSSRAVGSQDLDVLAPGSYVVAPWQDDSGHLHIGFLDGTSFASPQVAGIVALMAQQDAGLTQADAERILEATAIPIAAGCRSVVPRPGAAPEQICWGANATGAGMATADAALGGTP